MRKFDINLEFDELVGLLKGENVDQQAATEAMRNQIIDRKLDILDELTNMLRFYSSKPQVNRNSKAKSKQNGASNVKLVNQAKMAYKLIKDDVNNVDNANRARSIYNINLRVNRDDIFTNYNVVKKAYDLLNELIDGSVINIEIYENLMEQSTNALVNYTYTLEQLNEIVELYNYMNGYNPDKDRTAGEILFTDDSTIHDKRHKKVSLGDVYFMNKRIDSVVNTIREKEFSPYEAMIYIHNYLTSMKYVDKGNRVSQMILGPLLGYRELICSGYASLTKAIIDRLNMPGLECEIQAFNFIKPDKSGYDEEVGHALSLIHIKDEKYDIDCSCYDDASGDDVEYNNPFKKGSQEAEDYKYLTNDSNKGRFTFFMYPKCDAWLIMDEKGRQYMIEEDTATRYEQIIYTDTNHKKLSKDLEHFEYLDHIIADESLIHEVLRIKNKPISLQTMIKGMYNVLVADPDMMDEYDGDNIAETIYLMIRPSIKTAASVYHKKAINCLSQACRKYGFHKRMSMAAEADVDGEIYSMIADVVAKLDKERNINSTCKK